MTHPSGYLVILLQQIFRRDLMACLPAEIPNGMEEGNL
jgi:hypothetical protein